MPRLVGLVAAAALAVAAGPAAVAGCSPQQAKNPSYLLVTLDVPTSLASPPHAALVEIASAAMPGPPQALCVQLEAPGAAVPASFVLQRDFGKDPGPRVTLQVTAFDTLEGGNAAIAGKDFPCPPVLPPALASPQTVTVDFCATKAEKLVFHVGASCCATTDGGAPDGGAGDGGAGDGGVDGGDAGAAGAAGCCPPMEVCGAGLGTDGYACAPGACCATKVSGACALEPAQ